MKGPDRRERGKSRLSHLIEREEEDIARGLCLSFDVPPQPCQIIEADIITLIFPLEWTGQAGKVELYEIELANKDQ